MSKGNVEMKAIREIRRNESWWRSKCQRNRDDDMGKRRKVKLTSKREAKIWCRGLVWPAMRCVQAVFTLS